MNNLTLRYLGIAGLVILTDFFLFPLSFTFLPGLNTKTVMAALGIAVLLLNTSDTKYDFLNKTFISLSIWAIGVSLACLFAVVINGTNDYTYVSYIVSMWVWLFAAYTLVSAIGNFHKKLSIPLIANYLTAVCVIQGLCVLGLAHSPSFLSFIDNLHIGFILTFPLEDRLQGIGCALDPAGVRFAVSLVILGYVIINNQYDNKYMTFIYLVSFLFITMTGNMVARTTIVGTGMAVIYWLYSTLLGNEHVKEHTGRLWKYFGVSLLVLLPITVYYYNVDAAFRDNIRFGFEGFFSLAEQGEWRVHSNDILKNMIIFPDNLKTWFIGDGYIENPSKGRDPFYVGDLYTGYYKNTDIGYLRFIFYCGLAGLACFAGFMIYATQCCMKKFPHDKMLFFLMLMLNFCIWLKVSTDIFQFFALFLAAPISRFLQEDSEDTADSKADTEIDLNSQHAKQIV